MANDNSNTARSRRMKKSELADRILSFLNRESKQAFNYKQIAFAIDATSPSLRMDLINILDDLAAAEEITEVSLGRYKAKSNRGNENVGTFVRRSNGRNAVVIDDEPIMVAERNSMHALNGDKVRVVISAARKGQDPGLPYRYPASVEKAADRIDAGITPEEIARREDFRGITTFTIDPRDAKDFDDALSLRRLANGNYEVGVHIADVTHYVTPGSVIDKEAQSRATSVYLVDRTIPMLPEHLSNGICSLRPDEEKLTFSAIFELDAEADVVHSRIGRTVIRSDRRFTYEEAQQVIETGQGDYAAEITALDALAKKLRARRFENGAIEFERTEVRFEIDADGRPVNVFFKEPKDANKLIEEFMLLANKTVAETIGKAADVPGRKKAKAKTFVYRVHDNPDPEKLANLSLISARFGHKINADGSSRAVNKSINKLLKEIKNTPEENLLGILAIRSMAKAVYTTENIGHYGLAFDYYTHFTSPIRRYPDMMVHRLLERYMDKGGRSADKQKYEDLCQHSSEMEQLASNAERASIRYKQVEYMRDRLGEVYTGTISGVTEWGLYVELDENMCEGLVPIRDLADDFYDYDEKNYCLTARRNHTRYTLGDRVKVQVARADLDRKQLDFALLSDDGQPLRKRTQEQHTSPAQVYLCAQRGDLVGEIAFGIIVVMLGLHIAYVGTQA